MVRVIVPLNVPLWLLRLLLRLDALPDPHAAQRTAHMAASAAFEVVDRSTRVSRLAMETARDGLPVDAGRAGGVGRGHRGRWRGVRGGRLR